MAVSVTNIKPCQSLHGESVLVTLNITDSDKLVDINVGQKATLGSNNKTGFVCSVDKLGHSFKINPMSPVNDLSSDGVPGYLDELETITLE